MFSTVKSDLKCNYLPSSQVLILFHSSHLPLDTIVGHEKVTDITVWSNWLQKIITVPVLTTILAYFSASEMSPFESSFLS